MKKRILTLVAGAALLISTSAYCAENNETENNNGESNWYRLRVMNNANELEKVISGELGLYSEDNKLYCKIYNKEKREITISNDLTEGLDKESYDKILTAVDSIKSSHRLGDSFKQEEEGDAEGFHFVRREEGYKTGNLKYTQFFTKITQPDKEKLFWHTLMSGYIQSGSPLINSKNIEKEVWRTSEYTLAINPIYYVGMLSGENNDIEHIDKKIIPLEILYSTAYPGKANFDLYLQDIKTTSVIPLGKFHSNVQFGDSGTGIAFIKTSIAIPSSIEEGILLMISEDIWGYMDWRMESHYKAGESTPYQRFIHRDLPLSIEYEPNEDIPGTVREVKRWNNDYPVKISDGSKIALEIKYHTHDYGCSFVDLYVK